MSSSKQKVTGLNILKMIEYLTKMSTNYNKCDIEFDVPDNEISFIPIEKKEPQKRIEDNKKKPKDFNPDDLAETG